MNQTLEYLTMFAQLPLAMRRHFSRTLSLDEARTRVRTQMEQREANLLRMARQCIYDWPASPYLTLLKLAGCEYGDLERLVRQDGVEGALRRLRESGVYVTFEQFKGRQPIERFGQTIPVSARDFDNPGMERLFWIQTGGSTGAATTVGVNPAQVAAQAAHHLLTLSAHGLLGAPSIRWSSILPAGSLRNIIRAAYIGQPPSRWFSPNALRSSRYWVKYGLATYYVIFWARACGLAVPYPEYVGIERAEVVARCAADLLCQHGRCLIQTNPSRSVRVVRAAQEAGLSLEGAVFMGSEEAATPAKLRIISDSGARFVSNYATVESSRIACGCARPAFDGDVHVMSDVVCLFSYPYLVENLGLTVPAFNLTTLLPSASKVMLNVQMDDYGLVEERHCGCELESLGYTTHLRDIRSYSKLTGEGVTLIGNELLNILESVLPSRFGGTPLDYQMVEEEDEQSLTRLYILVHPRLGEIDEQAVVDTILQGMSSSSPMADAARTVWQQMQTVRVRRAAPIVTGRGKLLPLHISHQPPNKAEGERS